MLYTKLSEYFFNKSEYLKGSSDPTAKYRAAYYEKTAKVLQDQKGAATIKGIDSLDISDGMKSKSKYWIKNPPKMKNVPSAQKSNKKRSNKTTSNKRKKDSRKDIRKDSRKDNRKNNRKDNRKDNQKSGTMSTVRNGKLFRQVSGIMGVGNKKAKELMDDGLKSFRQLYSKRWQDKLPDVSKLWLKYKPVRRIPHSSIRALDDKLFSKHKNATLVGSYRRKKPFSKDIDVLLKTNSKTTLKSFVEGLNAMAYNMGPDKASVILRVDKIIGYDRPLYYKIDIFAVKPGEYTAMLLYSTGSQQNNIKMRTRAKKKGYLLNQRGLFKRGTDEKIPLKTEKDYYDVLELTYIPLEER